MGFNFSFVKRFCVKKINQFNQIKEWTLVDAIPTYGLILFSVFCVSLFAKKNFFWAMLSVLVGTDFLATSFAFMFASVFIESKANKHIRIKIAITAVVYGMIFILVKVSGLDVPVDWKSFIEHKDFVNFFLYPLFSISSIIFTFGCIYDVRCNPKYFVEN